jgi:heme exporter protein A
VAASLRFTGIRRTFGRLRVLHAVEGAVSDGGLLAIGGRNGSGKSTLLRVLAGLLAPDAGSVELAEDGTSHDTAARRRRVGYVAPDLALYEELTVAENLTFFTRLRRLPTSRTDEILAQIALPPGRPVGALSSGMRQRLRWGWALLHRPRLLLLDEPFQNLDATGEELTRSWLAAHLAGGGMAVVASPIALTLPGVTASLILPGSGTD